MKKDIENDFNLGGSVERAIAGEYEINAGEVFREAWSHTVKNYLSFSPAILVLIFVQFAILITVLYLQLDDVASIQEVLNTTLNNPTEPHPDTHSVLFAFQVATFSYEVLSAPIYAGVSLMAMSHAAGLSTKPRHLAKGLQFTFPVILATMCSLILQQTLGQLLPFVSLYFLLAFSNSTLLICEKKISPLQSLLLSLRAVNKKILVLGGIYATMFISLVFPLLLLVQGGIASILSILILSFALPFFFHVKGIIYRNMFGIKLRIVASDRPKDDDENDNDGNSQVFNA